MAVQGAVGFADVVGSGELECGVEGRVRQRSSLHNTLVIFGRTLLRNNPGFGIGAGVIPGLGENRWHSMGRPWLCGCIKDLRIQLVDAGKATELAVDWIEIAMMIAIAGHKLGVTDMVDGFDLLHHLYRKR